MSNKKYLLRCSLLILMGMGWFHASSSAQISQGFLNLSTSVVTPNFSFGNTSGFYDNITNSPGKTGYADIGFGATTGITVLFDSLPFGLNLSASYSYNPFDIESYVGHINNFPQNHFKALNATGYTQESLLASFLFTPQGLHSMIDLRIIGGILLCYSPYIADSGHTDSYNWPLQEYGPTATQPSHTIASAWGFGVDALLPISERWFFSASAYLIVSEPLFNTSQQISYLDHRTDVFVTQTTAMQYQLWVTTTSLTLGVSCKIGKIK